jgi:DNA modification methylase
MSTLHHGSCKRILKRIPDESVDLIYLDPPFKTGRNWYKTVVAVDAYGAKRSARRFAYKDSWGGGRSERVCGSVKVEHC